MESSEEIIKKEEQIKSWFKDPYNITLVLIMVIAFAIRLYYFLLTKNQPLWWDEADYMATAKSFAGIMNYQIGVQRLPGFPAFAALFYILGIKSEVILRFILCFIPSLLVILFTYISLEKMYNDRKIALISTVIITVLWENLFYSNRFHTENLALLFELLALIVLFVCYLKKQNILFIKAKYALIWIILFSIVSVLFRPGDLIFIPAIFVFIVLLNSPKLFANRKNIIITLLIFLTLIAVFIFALFNLSKYPMLGTYYHPQDPITWSNITVFYGFYQSIIPNFPSLFYYAFLIGLVLFCFDLYFFYPKLKKINRSSEDLEFKSDIFNILLILSVMFFFIFMIRPASYEFRWFFPLLPGMLAFTSKGIIKSSEFVSSFIKIKNLSVFLIIIVVLLGAYTQYYHADQIIRNKLTSYEQIKDSGLWLKSNSNSQDTIITQSSSQHAYYSERKTYPYTFISAENETALNDFIKRVKPSFIVVSIFEPNHPTWMIHQETYSDNSRSIIMPYMNSSVTISSENKVNTDIKPVIKKQGFSLTLVYPTDRINGVFVYKIDY